MPRYVFTQYLFGGEPFSPRVMDSLTDPALRALGLTPSPAVAVRTWRTAYPVFRAATADEGARYELSLPSGMDFSGVVDLPNSTDAAEVNTITKVEKTFEGELPAKPWSDAMCSAVGITPGSSACRSGSTVNGVILALSRALTGSGDEAASPLATRYGFFARFRGGAGVPLVEVSSSGGGLWILLALGLGAMAMKAGGAGGAVAGLGRTFRARKRARRRRRAGHYSTHRFA
jgi:hypothetical protein